MSESKKVYHIFTPNPGFTGTRNVGKHSTHFEKGVVAVENKTTAEVFVKNFNYLCPEFDDSHLEKVIELHGEERMCEALGLKFDSKEKSEEPFDSAQDEEPFDSAQDEESGETGDDSDDGKVEIEFILEHKVGANSWAPSDRARFKATSADKLIEKGKAKLVEATE